MVVNTSLASQLRQLKTPQSSLLVHRKFKPSFLFDEKEAANLDRETVYELGLSGLEELKKLNPDFSKFEKTLFDEASKSFERSVETAEVNELLNQNIKEICILMSPYFLLKPSHKVLEWLINRYHVDRFNIDELLFLGLPYHESMTFARLIQLFHLQVDMGKWNWLTRTKKSGTPLSKTALLNRAATDTAFFKFVCSMPVEAIKVCREKSSMLNTLFSFFCSTIVGALEYAKPINDLHVSLVLLPIMKGLSTNFVDFTSSCYIILARLCTKTQLSEKLIDAIYNKISKVNSDKLKHETALLLIVISQSSDCAISTEAVMRLSNNVHLIPSISYWSSRNLITITLVLNLLRALLKVIENEDVDEATREKLKTFVDQMLALSFEDEEAASIFKVFIEEWTKVDKVWFKSCLENIQASNPHGFDKAITELLKNGSESKKLKQLIGLTSSRSHVFDNLIHPNPQLRVEAIKQIKENYTPDQVGWLCDSVLARLEDDSPEVIEAALSCTSALEYSDKSYLCTILYRTLIKCWSEKSHNTNLAQAFHCLLKYSNDDSEYLDLIIFPVLAINPELAKDAPPNNSKLIKFIQACPKENKKEKAFLLLDNMPMYSSVKKYLHDLCKQHPVFKFISLLLLAKEPSGFDSSLLSDYIDSNMIYVCEHDKLDSSDTLKSCLDICRKGKLPLQPVLHYIAKSSIHTNKCDTQIRMCFDVESDKYKPLLNIFTIMLHGIICNNQKKNNNIFKQTANLFLKENFPELESRVYFLLSCALYGWEYDTTLVFPCIDILNKHIPVINTQSQSLIDDKSSNDSEDTHLLKSLLSLNSPAVPMLAALLHYNDINVRNKVLKIFEKLVEIFSPMPGFRGFVEQIIPCSEELKLDPEQITILCYTQLSPNKEIRSLLPSDLRSPMKDAFNSFLSLMSDEKTPNFVIARLLEVMECVNSTSFLLSLLPLLKKYIGKNLTLTPLESTIVKLILKKFDDQQCDNFNDSNIWKIIDIILSDSATSIIEDVTEQEITNPAAYFINVFPPLLYENLPDPKKENQEKLISLIITKTYECENIKISNAVSHFFKRISVDGEIIANILKCFNTSTQSSSSPTKPQLFKKIRKSLSNVPSLEILETEDWKKGVFLLEQIQSKSKLNDLTILIPSLFDILKKCLLFEAQSPVEYTKQLVLSVLLDCFQSMQSSPVSPDLIQVDLIVQCLRVSQNPQTHHHTLLALTHIANILPEKVLHSIMEIFTFIGNSIARQDDAYSFQIISKLIETIIPILTKGKHSDVIGVIRVFVYAMLDIPEHRRQMLLIKLLTILDPEEHLWIFLALVFESNVMRQSLASTLPNVISGATNNEEDSSVKTKKLEIASQLCGEFSVDILLKTAGKLLELSIALPHDKGVKENEVEISKEINDIFNLKNNSGKQLRHFKYILLGFVSQLLSSNTFVQEVALMDSSESSLIEDKLRKLMQLCLNYVKDLSKYYENLQTENSAQFNSSAIPQAPITKYWKVMINQSYEVLDKVVGMLPLSGFVSVSTTLLTDENCCSRKVLELITWRLSQGLSSDKMQIINPLLTPVADMSFNPNVDPLTRQTSLITLKLLTRHLALTHTKKFTQVLTKLVNLLCSDTLPPWEVVGSMILCLGELVSCLGAHSISSLNKYMPALLCILKTQANNGELFLLSCVTCLHKIVDCLYTFLSPYMEAIIYRVCYLTACLSGNQGDNHEKSAPIITKLKLIRNKISSSVDSRILVPSVSECYKTLIKKEQYKLVPPLMSILSDSFSAGVKSSSELTTFFINALAFRSEYSAQKADGGAEETSNIDLVEPHVISALMCLVLKLSESAFRPLFHKIYDWALRGSNDPLKAITFYRLSSGLAEKLRGLFVLFSGLFVSNCSMLLNKFNKSKNESLPCSEEDSILLIESIIKTLLSVFTYDTHNFLTKERFILLMQPLVDQMENDLGGMDSLIERCHKLITPCLANMSTATTDDSLWKQLNYQVLLKMRHDKSEVRLAALETVYEIAKKLGEDFLPLLPETVPFLAELLEDTDENIEKQTHQIISSMESVLGEPIQKYF